MYSAQGAHSGLPPHWLKQYLHRLHHGRLAIGVARILSGVHFFLAKKLTTFFLVVALKRLSKYV